MVFSLMALKNLYASGDEATKTFQLFLGCVKLIRTFMTFTDKDDSNIT